ncbi:uncharacterized protein LOC127871968 [Dreissena polymorpha]|uniref:uncharacterized protein LOC127871968 n=1 Tax=Dreissena polymorpha TaxID=45954 RepID=UPI0022651588|nr:uncharacterized protein LOC127871968 [Dreissena polymorpha]
MAYFGNSMFGHNLEFAAYASETSGGFGNSNGKRSGFSAGGPSFGNSSFYPNDINGALLAQNNPHLAGNYGLQGSFLMRQNSLLAEMTKSKDERKKNPWGSSSFSYPLGSIDNSVLQGLNFEKPEEKKRPKLQKQMSMVPQTGDDDEEIEEKPFMDKKTRAPSFASDPVNMRSKTISTQSMPIQGAENARITRSMSINEGRRQPANMDLAMPMLKRQQSLDAEKFRRKSLKRKPSFSFHFGSHRRSSKSVSDTNSVSGVQSDTPSAQSPQRSRSNTHESRTSTNTDSSTLQPSVSSKGSKNKLDDEKAHEQLILSLMNPAPKDEVFDSMSSPEDNSTNYSHMPSQKHEQSSAPREQPEQKKSPKQSKDINPTSPVRQNPNNIYIPPQKYEQPSQLSQRQEQKTSQKPNKDINSSSPIRQYLPPIDNQTKRQSPSPAHATALTEMPQIPEGPRDVAPPLNKKNLNPDPNVSDCSNDTTYYDCASQQNSPRNGRIEVSAPVESLPRPKKKTGNDTSISTDGEDTTSTCDTPPRKMYQNSRPMYQPVVDYPNESPHKPYENLEVYTNQKIPNEKVNSKEVARQKPRRPNIPRDSFQGPDTQTPESEIHHPILSRNIQNGNEPKDQHESGESSESGYATSHHPLSQQEDYHMKVSQYVRSLPSNPDINEKHSGSDTGVKNGSLSDSDSDEQHSVVTKPKKIQIKGVDCVSGSESEDNGNKSDSDVSVSQLEVMKILESPIHVRERVADNLNKMKNDPNFTGILPSPQELYRKGDNSSYPQIMEIKADPKFDQNDLPDGIKQQPKENLTQASEVNLNRSNGPDSSRSDKSSKAQNTDRQFSIKEKIFERLNSNYGRPYESSFETKTTSCINVLLNILNMILFLASMAIIGICLWLILKDFNVDDVTSMLGDNLMQVIVYITLSAAGVAVLAACCLCCGVRDSRNGLAFYAFALVLATIAFGTSCILTTIFADKLSGIEYRFNFKDKLLTIYGLTTDIETKILTDAWDAMQTEFQCCGAEGHENDTDSWALYSKTAWLQNNPDRGLIFVPESCCRKNSNTKICQGSDNKHLGPPRWPYSKAFPHSNPALNTDGCYPFLSSYLQTLSKLAALTTGCLAGLYFLAIMLTWIFCFKKRRDFQIYYCYSQEDEEMYCNSENNEESLRLVISESEHYFHHDKLDSDETKLMGLPTRAPEKSSLKSSNDYSKPVHQEHADQRKSVKTAYFEDEQESESEMYEDHGSEKHSPRDQRESDNFIDRDTERFEPLSETPSDVIDRRNMWLSGSNGGHLLSLAITEEDSDYQDTDDDIPKGAANV